MVDIHKETICSEKDSACGQNKCINHRNILNAGNDDKEEDGDGNGFSIEENDGSTTFLKVKRTKIRLILTSINEKPPDVTPTSRQGAILDKLVCSLQKKIYLETLLKRTL